MDSRNFQTLPPEHDHNHGHISSPEGQSPTHFEYLQQKYSHPLPYKEKTLPLKNSLNKPHHNKQRQRSLGSQSSKTMGNEKGKSLKKGKENLKIASNINEKKVETKAKNEKHERNEDIKEYLIGLEAKIDQQQKKIRNIKASLEERKTKFEEYSRNLKETKKYEKLLETYENEKQRIEKNEQILIKNLTNQQKLTKEALSRLYNYQEDALREKGQMKEFYDAQLNEQLAKIRQKYKNKVKILKQKNNELSSSQNRNEALLNEINGLKAQINVTLKEKEAILRENAALKEENKERRDHVETEINLLKSRIDQDNENYSREIEEKNALKQKIQSLMRELEINQRKNVENETFYRQETEKLEQKIESLQDKIRQSQEYKGEIEEMAVLLRKKESECLLLKQQSQEIHLKKENMQHNQKQQWGKIYSELMEEIKCLKNEIDLLGNENKKLLSSAANTRFGSESQQQAYLSSNRF